MHLCYSFHFYVKSRYYSLRELVFELQHLLETKRTKNFIQRLKWSCLEEVVALLLIIFGEEKEKNARYEKVEMCNTECFTTLGKLNLPIVV
jgi:hypothetical protein